jgi:hypothetical protein
MNDYDFLPRQVAKQLEEFMRAEKTGRLELDIRGGCVVGARLIDAIPVSHSVRVER